VTSAHPITWAHARGLLSATLVLTLLLAGRPALADPAADAERAEAFYIQATQLFNAGRYQEALENFDRAIELQPDPVFFCNRSTVLLKLKEFKSALASLEVCRSQYAADGEEEAVQIDTEYKALSVFVELIEPHSRAVAARIASGAEAVDRPPTVIVEEGGEALKYAAWGTGGLAVALLGTALVFDLASASLIDDYESVGAAGTDREQYVALQTKIEGRQQLIGTLLVVGLLSAAASGVLFWLDLEDAGAADASTSARWQPWCSPTAGGASAGLSVTF